MTEPSDPATLRQLADEFSKDIETLPFDCTGSLYWRMAKALREAAASLEHERWARTAQEKLSEAALARMEAAEALCATLRQEKDEAVESIESLAWPKHIPPTAGGNPDIVSHFRSMAARFTQSRDEMKHENRKLKADLAAAEASRDEALRQVEELRQVASRACQTLLATRASQETNG